MLPLHIRDPSADHPLNAQTIAEVYRDGVTTVAWEWTLNRAVVELHNFLLSTSIVERMAEQKALASSRVEPRHRHIEAVRFDVGLADLAA